MRPPRAFRSQCRDCGKKIGMFPYTNRAGQLRWMPVDMDENNNPPVGETWDPRTMRSHFGSCPKADEFRRTPIRRAAGEDES